MATASPAIPRRYAFPAYVATLSLVFFPLFDQGMQLITTAKIHDARWRFGAAGLFSNLLLLPAVGLLAALLLSNYFGHRWMERTLAILCAIAAVILLLVSGLFLLDAVQVRALMPPRALSSWTVATVTALVKFLLALITLAGFARAGIRRIASGSDQRRPAASSSLVVGSSGTKQPAGAVGTKAEGN